MEFEKARIDLLIQELKRTFGRSTKNIRIICSPYRICPLGAHVDHQLGLVTGMCIDHNILLAYVLNSTGTIRLRSKNFPGLIQFSIHDELATDCNNWGKYLEGAVYALAQKYPLKFGFDGIIEGNLPIGGLSSSAAVGLAYLLALEDVNQLSISHEENIRFDQIIENEFIGLNNGILDQSTILMSQKDKLLYLDCQSEVFKIIAPPKNIPNFNIVVVYSGLSQALCSTDYNRRVSECQQAAKLLLKNAGIKLAKTCVLRDVPNDVYETYRAKLPKNLGKRARHFFSELNRVEKSLSAWKVGDFEIFGSLMNQSGKSSIENYECGSPHLISIFEILTNTEGVYGARFSGAGFRGSCIGLIDPNYRESIEAKIKREYPRKHPDISTRYSIHFCNSDKGVRIL